MREKQALVSTETTDVLDLTTMSFSDLHGLVVDGINALVLHQSRIRETRQRLRPVLVTIHDALAGGQGKRNKPDGTPKELTWEAYMKQVENLGSRATLMREIAAAGLQPKLTAGDEVQNLGTGEVGKVMSDIKEDEEGVPRVEVVYKDEKPVTEPVTDLDKVKPPIVRTVKVGDLFYCADRGAEYSYVGKGQWQRTQTPTDADQKKLDAVEAKRNKDAAEAKRQADAEQKKRAQDAEAARRDLDHMNALRAAVEDVISKRMTICDAAKAHGVSMTAIKKDERFIEAIKKTRAKKVVTSNATKGTYRYEVKKLTNGNNMYALMKFTVDFNKKEGKSELIGSESQCIAKKEELEGKTAPAPKPAAGLVHIRKRCGGARDSWTAMCNYRALDGSEYPSHGVLRATDDKHDKPNCPACFAKREANKVRKTHAIDVKGTKTQWSDCFNKGRTYCSQQPEGRLIAAKGEEPTCEKCQRYTRPTSAESGYTQNPNNPFEWLSPASGTTPTVTPEETTNETKS